MCIKYDVSNQPVSISYSWPVEGYVYQVWRLQSTGLYFLQLASGSLCVSSMTSPISRSLFLTVGQWKAMCIKYDVSNQPVSISYSWPMEGYVYQVWRLQSTGLYFLQLASGRLCVSSMTSPINRSLFLTVGQWKAMCIKYDVSNQPVSISYSWPVEAYVYQVWRLQSAGLYFLQLASGRLCVSSMTSPINRSLFLTVGQWKAMCIKYDVSNQPVSISYSWPVEGYVYQVWRLQSTGLYFLQLASGRLCVSSMTSPINRSLFLTVGQWKAMCIKYDVSNQPVSISYSWPVEAYVYQVWRLQSAGLYFLQLASGRLCVSSMTSPINRSLFLTVGQWKAMCIKYDVSNQPVSISYSWPVEGYVYQVWRLQSTGLYFLQLASGRLCVSSMTSPINRSLFLTVGQWKAMCIKYDVSNQPVSISYSWPVEGYVYQVWRLQSTGLYFLQLASGRLCVSSMTSPINRSLFLTVGQWKAMCIKYDVSNQPVSISYSWPVEGYVYQVWRLQSTGLYFLQLASGRLCVSSMTSPINRSLFLTVGQWKAMCIKYDVSNQPVSISYSWPVEGYVYQVWRLQSTGLYFLQLASGRLCVSSMTSPINRSLFLTVGQWKAMCIKYDVSNQPVSISYSWPVEGYVYQVWRLQSTGLYFLQLASGRLCVSSMTSPISRSLFLTVGQWKAMCIKYDVSNQPVSISYSWPMEGYVYQVWRLQSTGLYFLQLASGRLCVSSMTSPINRSLFLTVGQWKAMCIKYDVSNQPVSISYSWPVEGYVYQVWRLQSTGLYFLQLASGRLCVSSMTSPISRSLFLTVGQWKAMCIKYDVSNQPVSISYSWPVEGYVYQVWRLQSTGLYFLQLASGRLCVSSMTSPINRSLFLTVGQWKAMCIKYDVSNQPVSISYSWPMEGYVYQVWRLQSTGLYFLQLASGRLCVSSMTSPINRSLFLTVGQWKAMCIKYDVSNQPVSISYSWPMEGYVYQVWRLQSAGLYFLQLASGRLCVRGRNSANPFVRTK